MDNLIEVLEKHQKWLRDEEGGGRADLQYADLRYAKLQYAKNFDVSKEQPDLYILKFQPPDTRLFAYKFLRPNFVSPYQNYPYTIGQTYTSDEIDEDEFNECGAGLNVATLAWCNRTKDADDILIKVSFLVKDIVAIPYNPDGKFRVKTMTVECQVKEDGMPIAKKRAKREAK